MLKPSYQTVEDVLLNNDATVSAAEAHGMLAGLLCINGDLDDELWLSLVFGQARKALNESELVAMNGLCVETRRLLGAVDFSFELFLPDDDAALHERAHALGMWCHGFLFGFGYAGAGRDWPGDCSEILRDLADISQLDDNVSGDADESAFSEISEFVRIGIQLIRGDLLQRALPKNRLH